MTQVLFDRLKSNLAQCINDGTIYFVTDSNGNFTQLALGDGSKSHVVGIGPKMDDATKQDLMSKLGLTISSDMGTIQLGKLSNYNGVSSQKKITYERTGFGTDTHEISTVGYVQQYMKTAKAMVYAGIFNAQTKEITDYNNAIISPSEEGNVTFDYLLNGNEGETLLTPGMSFIVGTAGNLEGYMGISIYGGETKVEMGDMIIIINVQQKEGDEGGSTYNEASILIIQNTNLKIADGAITTAKIADAAVTNEKLSTDIQPLIRNLSKTATYAGIATPTTNPGTPDGSVFYIAKGKGTYTNFGGIDVTEDEIVILYYDTEWHKEATGIASNNKLTELDTKVDEIYGNITNNTPLELYVDNGIYKYIPYSYYNFAFNVEGCTNVTLRKYKGRIFRVFGANEQPAEGITATEIISLPAQDTDGFKEVKVSGYKYVSVQYDTRTIKSTNIVLDSGIVGIKDRVDNIVPRVEKLEGIISIDTPINAYVRDGVLTAIDHYRSFILDAKESKVISFPIYNGIATKVFAFNEIPVLSSLVEKTLVELPSSLQDGSYELNIGGYRYITIQYDSTQVERIDIITDDNMSYLKKELGILKDDISNTDNKITNLKGYYKDSASSWVLGLYSGGIYEHHAARITHANNELTRLTKGDIVIVDEGFKYYLSYFDKEGIYRKKTSWTNDDTIIEEDEAYVIVVLAYNNDRVIPSEDIENVSKKIHLFAPFSALYESKTGKNSIIERNAHRLDALYAITRSNIKVSSNKDFASMLCSDMHYDLLALSNAIEYVNSNDRIDALFLLGDQVSTFYKKSEVEKINEKISASKRPVYSVIGNHDVGSFPGIGVTGNHKQMYESYVKPMVDKGWILPDELPSNASEGKPYYYHDFNGYKIRIICLYEYDQPLTSADMDTRYWKPIAYSSLYNTISYNTAYSIGSKINVKDETGYGYTDYSFECVQSCTTPSAGTKERVEDAYKLPTWKIHRGYRVIRQEQAQWFLNTLLSTPSGYSVIVMCHNPYSEFISGQKDKKFCSNIDNPSIFTRMDDFVADAIDAFQNGLNFVHKVRMKDEAEYLNVNTDASENYAYEVSCDFRNKNAGARFACLFGGHMHLDAIFKHNTYNQYQVLATTANTSQIYIGGRGADMARAKEDCLSYDCLTVVGQDADNQKIRLMKIGQTVTTDCTLRDQEVIGLN